MLSVLEAGAGRGAAGPAGPRHRPGLDLRPGDRRAGCERRRGRVRRPLAPADPRRGVRPARPARRREGVDRPVHQRPPAQGGARRAAREGRRAARRGRELQGRRVGDRRRDRHAVQEDPHADGHDDGVRHARRPRGHRRDPALREERWRSTRACWPSTRSCSCAGAWTTRTRRRPVWSSSPPSRSSRRPSEVESAREAAANRADRPGGRPAARSTPRGCPRRSSTSSSTSSRTSPGETEVVLAISTATGARTLRLGPSYRVSPTPSLRAELANILGSAALPAPASPAPA